MKDALRLAARVAILFDRTAFSIALGLPQCLDRAIGFLKFPKLAITQASQFPDSQICSGVRTFRFEIRGGAKKCRYWRWVTGLVCSADKPVVQKIRGNV
ncbi:MAG: hypothetical protein R3C28_01440 [Pirellulaceae bacterium]